MIKAYAPHGLSSLKFTCLVLLLCCGCVARPGMFKFYCASEPDGKVSRAEALTCLQVCVCCARGVPVREGERVGGRALGSVSVQLVPGLAGRGGGGAGLFGKRAGREGCCVAWL